MSDRDFDQDQNNEETNPLMVPLHEEEQPTQEQIMEQWFSQDIFAEAAEEGVFEKSDSEGEKEEEEKITKVPKKSKTIDSIPSKIQVAEHEDFEIVPSEPLKVNDDSSSSSSDEDSSDEDEDTKAEILAYAKKMLRKRKREEILDDGYNKYMFDDEGLPKWFVEEEKKHCVPMKPITREEVAAMKAQFREIDARPAKKVAQAKARKKRATMKRLEKVKQKSNTISEQTDISERSKRKMIEQLYKKAAPKKPQKEYVVAKKGVQVRPGKGKKLVDPRMKKDARLKGMGRQKGGGKKGKVGKGKGKKGGPKGKGLKAGGGKGRKKGGKMSMQD